ncbi:MAG TPA: hypothetical protein VII22_15805 [Streptosporangiaceae bacterium]
MAPHVPGHPQRAAGDAVSPAASSTRHDTAATPPSPGGLRLLPDLRRSLLEPPRQLRPRTAATAQPAGGSGTVSTVA